MRMIFSPLRQNCSKKQAISLTGVRSLSSKYATYFNTLNLPTTASKAQVRSKYLELVKTKLCKYASTQMLMMLMMMMMMMMQTSGDYNYIENVNGDDVALDVFI